MPAVEFPRLRVGQIIDSSWKLFRTHWKHFIGLVGIVFAPFIIIQELTAFFASGGLDAALLDGPDTSTAEDVVYLAFALLSIFITPYFVGPATWATLERIEGREPTFKQAFKAVRKRYWSIIGVLMLYAVGSVVVAISAVALISILFLVRPVLGIVAGFAFGLVYIWLLIRTGLIFPASILDGFAPRSSIAESFRLTRGYAWRIALVWAVTGSVALVFYFAWAFIAGLVPLAMSAMGLPYLGITLLIWLLGIGLLGSVMSAFAYVLSSVLYIELKARQEPPVEQGESLSS